MCETFFSSPKRPDGPWGPTERPIQWVPEDFFPGVKRPVREADHPPPSSAEVKNAVIHHVCPDGMHRTVIPTFMKGERSSPYSQNRAVVSQPIGSYLIVL